MQYNKINKERHVKKKNYFPDKIEKLEIDLDGKLVYVTSNLSSEQLLETIKKTGKETSYVGIKN